MPCGRTTLIDDADLPLIQGYCLYSKVDRKHGLIYVQCCLPTNRKRYFKLHKMITGYKRTDHKDGNGLNNQRSNLRDCTHAQNIRNSRRHVDSTCNFKGVAFDKRRGKWFARICIQYKTVWGGSYKTELEAAVAYDVLAKKYHGEFARLNFPAIHA
jgi:hypothetical protein